jgi:PAS domain S-box-containing protein
VRIWVVAASPGDAYRLTAVVTVMGKRLGSAQGAAQRAEPSLFTGSSEDAIVLLTGSGVIRGCNPAAVRLFGYPGQDLIGQPATVLTPPGLQGHEAEVLRQVLTGGEVEPSSTYRIRRDGAAVLVSWSLSSILNSSGAVVGAAIVSRASTAGQKVPDDLRALSDPPALAPLAPNNGNHGASDAEANDRADHLQDRFQALADSKRAEERVQIHDAQDRFQVRMGDQRAQERVEVDEAHEQFQIAMDVELAKERVQIHDAQDRFQVRMGDQRAQERVAVDDAQDQFQIVMDAERAQAQADREHLQLQLQQSQRLEVLGQLAGGVAHDFNNLLAVILNYAAFVAEEIAAQPGSALQDAARDIGQIQRAAERATGLTHQLLAFARREVVQPRVLDLTDVVTGVQQLLDRTIGEDVVLRTELADDLWPVLADTGQIEQVLCNLAVNARDAMSGGGTLSIDTANIIVDDNFIAAGSPMRAGRHVRLRIGDTGTGMPPEVLEHAFEPFFTTKRDGTGTGLGLATVYGIVSQAGATVDIHSQVGVGTTFTIMIPVTDEAPTPIEERPSYERTPAGEMVLIVEDEQALREVTERIFTRSGYP